MTLRLDVGARVPIAATAIGRALLAAVPQEEREFLMTYLKKRETAQTYDRLRGEIEESIAEIRERGFCTVIGEWRPEVNGVGVPIITSDRNVYAVNCGGPAFKVSREMLETELGPKMVALANRISVVKWG